MFDWLRRLFGGSRSAATERQADPVPTPYTPDPELKEILDRIERKALDKIHAERAAEALLSPRERIKKRLNLPSELPADYRAEGTAPVLSPAHTSGLPMMVVMNNAGIGLNLPRVVFDYLYRQHSPTADEQRVINECLAGCGLPPESF